MKKVIRSIVVPLGVAIVIGFLIGRYVYAMYYDSLYDGLSSSRLYLVLNGEYDNIDSMRENNSGNNYVYYVDDNKYNTVVGITNNYDNIDKIKELYDDNLRVMEYYVSSDILDSKQLEYDDIIKNTDDKVVVKEAVDNILNLYRNDDNIRLIAIN